MTPARALFLLTLIAAAIWLVGLSILTMPVIGVR